MKILRFGALFVIAAACVFAQTSAPQVDVQILVTVADQNNQPATLRPGEVVASDGDPLEFRRAEPRDLELFILIDDTANYDFGKKLQELRRFVAAQGAETPVGSAYIHEGLLTVTEAPTVDHGRVSSSLHVPAGGKVSSPYCAISDLIARWPASTLRRAIILVSTGIDDSARNQPVCVNAEMAIADAERATVTIYALYNPLKSYVSESWSDVDTGISDLAHVCYETRGKAYFLSHDSLDSVDLFLSDITDRLQHQYFLKVPLGAAPHDELRRGLLESRAGSRVDNS